jgi:hypothetical protein
MDFSTRATCLQNTRIDILQSIIEWVYQCPRQRVLWLRGLAGSGKSTLSTTIALFFQKQRKLGAFVFFDRDVDERCQPSNVVRTLAYQLGSYDSRIAEAVAHAINTTHRIMESPLRLQFFKLIVEPLKKIPIAEIPMIVVILDALDECGSSESRTTLLSILSAESVHLPLSIRIVVTSRTEFDIRASFSGQSHISVQELDITSDNNNGDILLYIRSRMEEIRTINPFLLLGDDWPGENAVLALAKRAAGLFVWAKTACRFIQCHEPRQRLDILLQGKVNGTAETALDELYSTALKSVGTWDDECFCSDFQSIMGIIVVAANPISYRTIDTLLSPHRPVRHTISRLECVLSWGDAEPVRILHPSFADFMLNRFRCGNDTWYIDASLQHRQLVIQCINHMESLLKQNLCDLSVSKKPVVVSLPESLSYAATSWIDHVCILRDGAECIAETLETFLGKHLLHWLEVMSILKRSRTTIASMLRLLDWLHVRVFYTSF